MENMDKLKEIIKEIVREELIKMRRKEKQYEKLKELERGVIKRKLELEDIERHKKKSLEDIARLESKLKAAELGNIDESDLKFMNEVGEDIEWLKERWKNDISQAQLKSINRLIQLSKEMLDKAKEKLRDYKSNLKLNKKELMYRHNFFPNLCLT